MCLNIQCDTRVKLNTEQRMGLKHLISLGQTLRDKPKHPSPRTGLDGMQTAHQILQERQAVGVLIGGLSEAVWNKRRTMGDLDRHKDVDVAVLDSSFHLTEKFEKGIDWWLPRTGKVAIKDDRSTIYQQQRWLENGNGVALSFDIDNEHSSYLRPGLYLPTPEWIMNMREYEVSANIDYDRIHGMIDDDVLDKLRAHIHKRVKICLAKSVKEVFSDYILPDVIELKKFTLPQISAISTAQEIQ